MHIPDMWEAVKDGLLPGKLIADPANPRFLFQTITTTNSRGAQLHWQIRVRLLDKDGKAVPFGQAELEQPVVNLATRGWTAVVETRSWQEDGQPRAGTQPTVVRAGKNLGKKNATNVVTQALRDALGLYNKHAKRGGVTAADRPLPMLVKKLGQTKAATLGPDEFAAGVIVQRKFNGVRIVARLDGAGDARSVTIYSRQGGDYDGLTLLRAELLQLLSAAGPEAAGIHLDGELYRHGWPLNRISGEARRSKEAPGLVFNVFDCFFPERLDMPYRERRRVLEALVKAGTPHVRVVENLPVASVEEVRSLSKRFVEDGYEGAIARKCGAAYEYGTKGYHSANLVKIKPIHDAEFDVIGYTQGTRGKDVGALIWVCRVSEAEAVGSDRDFNVVPKDMSYADRYHVFRCLGQEVPDDNDVLVTRFDRDFLNRPLTVEFPERSAKTGKPVQAKALIFRTYEPTPERPGQEDPLARLFRECPR